MSGKPTETTFQAIRRHLRNGYVILTERGATALFGAAMREAAKIVDSPVGVFLDPRDIRRDGPALVRSQGLRAATGAVLRQIAAEYDPPLGRSKNPVNEAMRASAIRYHYTYELTLPDGVIPARRPTNDVDFALEVPFAFPARPQGAGAIAAIVHAFYPNELQAALSRLQHVPRRVDLFVSTDSEEKRGDIARQTIGWTKGSVDIRVMPNRGRDVAAKFVGFRDVYERYDLFVHLHIKKSPHGGAPLARWRDYLFDNLIGSPETAASILSLFDDPKMGIVFPQHLFEIRGILNWGYDYDLARGLMQRMGVEIDKNLVLEFPSGSMFWGRSAAIRPLLELGLTFEDFPEEAGQVDGTIAHAIERIVLMQAESAGFEWMKVVQRDLYPLPATVLPVTAPADIARHRLKVFQPCLCDVDAEQPPFARTQREYRPMSAYPSRNAHPRLTLVVPTVNPQQAFGGVATAIKLLRDWGQELGPDYDRRIVVTDAEIEADGYASLPDFTPTPFTQSLDETTSSIVDAKERAGGRLDIRARDIFVASAWWTVDIVRGLERDRARFHGGARPFVYLIQDDEPYFDGWGSRHALAESTYAHGESTIAVVNSEELFAIMTAKHRFAHSFCVPYALNESIAARLEPRSRECTILVYGRPTVARNCFEIICEALTRWQQRDPIRASRWRIVFLGEAFETGLAYPVQNATVEGKVSLDAYADHLNRAAVGISLMVSPHPSYPPLEMAEAGVLTIANDYAGKDLRARFPDIVALRGLHPAELADAIYRAVSRAEPLIGKIAPRCVGAAPPSDAVVATPQVIAALLREAFV